MTTTTTAVRDALALRPEGDGLVGEVHEGWDVFGIPHGGYLAALTANAVLTASDAPDVFTSTVHFLRKAAPGALRFAVARVGGSRRFASWTVTATQDDAPVLTALVSVGDRTTLAGPSWTDRPHRPATDAELGPPAGGPAIEAVFPTPAIAQLFSQRLVTESATFALGRASDEARLRARITTDEPDQLTAIIASDITPPAVWNVLGPSGWVPTVELTTHVRASPAPGPLSIEVTTHHVTDGFVEEDALVHDATGALVVQSRQLARVSAPPT
jgi:hypothetical protein